MPESKKVKTPFAPWAREPLDDGGMLSLLINFATTVGQTWRSGVPLVSNIWRASSHGIGAPGSRLSDRTAWAIFATGVGAMLVVFYVAVEYGDYGDTTRVLLERRRLLGRIFFAVAAFAISGPLTASFGTWIASRPGKYSGKKQKAIGLGDL